MMNKILLSVLFLISATFSSAQQTPEEVAEWLGAGWNIGNQLDAHRNGVSNETCWGNGAVTPALFDSLKAVGVKSVRIPVTWMGHIGDAPRYEIEHSWMNRVKEVVGYAHNAGLNVIINTHHDGDNSRYWINVSKAAKDIKEKKLLLDKFTAVWKQIAIEFRNEGEWLVFEPFNELHDGKWGWGDNLKDSGAQYDIVNVLNQRFVDVVRNTGGKNRNRWLAVAGYCADIQLTVEHLKLPKDKTKNRLIVGVHCYSPHNYTLEAKYHKWGGEDENKLKEELKKVYDAYVTKGIPVYIGEMGCVRRADAKDEAVRLHYLRCFARYCKQFSLPYFYWDNGSPKAGRECSGLLNHATGEWYNDGKGIMTLLADVTIPRQRDESWQMIWNDEFDKPLDRQLWHSEHGFVRNHEAQWYQAENAYTKDGLLVLEAKIDSIENPRYKEGSSEWQRQRPYAKYSSASVNTSRSFAFMYGQMEVRARIPAVEGSWPAIWTLGKSMQWPSCGECDILEFYHINGKPHILANAAWGDDKPYHAIWNSKHVPYKHFYDRDPWWSQRFHTWLMDWTEDYIRIFLDGELINDIDITNTINGSIGKNTNPFHTPHYILLNLALGGDNGGRIHDDTFPMKYEIDYVRVWQKK